jgi:3-mercaptopyruvate sulfurtransferase SseA
MSDQAWIIMRRSGCKNMKVLEGGLNKFFLTLMDPPKPTETDPSEVFEKYSFRKAAGIYFGMPNPQEFIPEQQIVLRKAKTRGKYAPKAKVPQGKKSVKLEKKKEVEEEEEDEGC